MLASRFNRPGHEIVDHHTFALVSDGDVMEGVSCEAASLAGPPRARQAHSGSTTRTRSRSTGRRRVTFSEDVGARYAAYGWHVQHVENGDTDLDAIDDAIEAALAETDAALARHRQDDARLRLAEQGRHVRGARQPARRRRGRRDEEGARLGLRGAVLRPDEALEHFREAVAEGRGRAAKTGRSASRAYEKAHPGSRRGMAGAAMAGELPAGWDAALPVVRGRREGGDPHGRRQGA